MSIGRFSCKHCGPRVVGHKIGCPERSQYDAGVKRYAVWGIDKNRQNMTINQTEFRAVTFKRALKESEHKNQGDWAQSKGTTQMTASQLSQKAVVIDGRVFTPTRWTI